jgi:peptidoglycan/LPS O-acetylase OafA/YrhL
MIWIVPILPYIASSLTRRSGALDRHMGNLSYPVYLFHVPFLALLVIHLGDEFWIKLGIALLACVFAAFVYWFYDRPIDRWRVRMTEGSAARR